MPQVDGDGGGDGMRPGLRGGAGGAAVGAGTVRGNGEEGLVVAWVAEAVEAVDLVFLAVTRGDRR